MKPSPNPNNAHRLQRIILWTALALAWAGEVAAGVMRRFRIGHRFEARLDAFVPLLARIVARIFVVEALMLYGRNFRIHKRFRSRAQIIRALVGPAIRRLMRGRTLGETIARLAYALRNRAAIVRPIVARIARGLTHAHIAPPRTQTLRAAPICAVTCAIVDTS